MTFTFFLALFFLPFSLFNHASAVEVEIRSLLEFKKGIKIDPSSRIFSTWVFPSDPTANLSDCPATFHGVSCDPYTSVVTAIALDGLGLVGELKFTTLVPLKYLQNLNLSENSLSGRLVPTLGQITSLQVIDLSGNQFYGPIPARLNDLWALHYLNLSNNNFSGWFPPGIRNLQQLKALDLRSNQLQGDLQGLISELRNVEHLDLSGNHFVGLMEMSVENVSSLANTVQYVNLSRNGLGGGFWGSDTMMLFRNLRVLDLSDNGIVGELPDFGQMPNLQVLQIRSNKLSGSLPEGLLQGAVPLLELDLSGNGFSGSVPNINSTTLDMVNISSNLLSGLLPPSSGNCRVVDLSRNMLSDEISVLMNWNDKLEILDLSSNNLTGSMPNLTQFQRLTVLSIRNNSLEGMLPSSLGSHPKISRVDLSSNRLDGLVPRTFFTSTTLSKLNLSGNHLTGSIPLEGSQTSELLVLPSIPPMESLDLSGNSLTGGLTPDIGNFARLSLLNLANNHLSGKLPNELSKLSGLKYIDLSHNSFNSRIPDGLTSSLEYFNVSYNNLSGNIPENLKRFPSSSFMPGNSFINVPGGHNNVPDNIDRRGHHSSRSSIKVAIIVACVGAVVMIAFVLLAYHRARLQDFRVRSGLCGQTAGRDVNLGKFSGPSLFRFHSSTEPPPTSLSFSNDHLLTSNSRSLSGQMEAGTEIVEDVSSEGVAIGIRSTKSQEDIHPTSSGRRSSPGSPIASSPSFIDTIEQPVTLDVYSPDRLAGELFFLDASLAFTAEELSRAPAEVLGRSSHGTLYKATLDNGHMLTVKWLRVGLVKHKKEFAKEVKKIGSVKHQNIVPLRAYYWGPREQERLILADYIQGDSLALHLYETTPRRYSTLQFNQRLKVAVDVARCLIFLHDRGLPHGNLKPTNILLEGMDYSVRLTDYGLHRLMTPAGIAEQILNLGALGYRAPELASATKPVPSFKADVYAFGVILMELLTRRSAGDIISGQSGAVDLTDWVRLCDQEGRVMDCIDRDIASGEEHLKAMDDMLAVSLKCILPVNERPNIKQVLEDLCSITV
ncbi:probable inactive receptor kinase At5g10020 [Olea europaea var. sylvestris]|uniref:probable inactive receptor kinase At5g10020 n=1 Tax=Olea europaea var. sylvestris TaxID=158386 RepID=UPI000C1D6D69|nr:probable inactive receptor kinase At5g10020 [Olea europaea var. sylvestris]